MMISDEKLDEWKKEVAAALQREVANPGGKIHLQCTMLEASRWQVHKIDSGICGRR